MILPFLTLLKDRNSILVSWENNQICITERTVSTNIQHRLFASDLKQPSTIKLKADETEGVILEPQSRVFDSAEPYIKILTNFAHKTYAPATEASRLAGAGAGLNDND